MTQIHKLKKLTYLRLASSDTHLIDSINKHNHAQISTACRLESLRVLVLEIVINPLKFAIFSSAYPNLEQLYLDQSRIVCLCQSAPSHLNGHFHTAASNGRIPRFTSTIDLYSHDGCFSCWCTLIKVLNRFEHLPHIDVAVVPRVLSGGADTLDTANRVANQHLPRFRHQFIFRESESYPALFTMNTTK